MTRRTPSGAVAAVAALAVLTLFAGGCETAKGTGTLAGAGVGALIGQAAGGTATSTVVGAAVGAGVGYIIGDQVDEKKAREQEALARAEVAPLGGTRWRVASVNTKQTIDPFVSKIVEFRPDGRAVTTTTNPNGEVVTADESYRVVGNTLILNKPGYLVNARFRIDGPRLIVDDPAFSAVLERLR